MTISISALNEDRIHDHLADLSTILAACVANGAAISFMQPFSVHDAQRFWVHDVLPEVIAGRRILLGALQDGAIVGAVQLITALPPNQSHRCEIAKMIVHPNARRQGIGRALMQAAITEAKALGKTMITLDTKTTDVAAPLYASVGFETAGIIPDFASDPDGRALHPTTYMFRRI